MESLIGPVGYLVAVTSLWMTLKLGALIVMTGVQVYQFFRLREDLKVLVDALNDKKGQ